jgi:hypothetical protein
MMPAIRTSKLVGAPVRAIHKTASTNIRLSRAVAPGSPALPGRSGAMRSLIVPQDCANQG